MSTFHKIISRANFLKTNNTRKLTNRRWLHVDFFSFGNRCGIENVLLISYLIVKVLLIAGSEIKTLESLFLDQQKTHHFFIPGAAAVYKFSYKSKKFR